jgi:periplasmic copper chaperone A
MHITKELVVIRIFACTLVALAFMQGAAPTFAQMPHGIAPAAKSGTITIGTLTITAPWTRATPAGARVGGGYMKITNAGKEPDILIGGSLPQAGRFELHEMAVTDGVMRMRELARGLEIKPGETVELKPGGYHVMFMDLKEPLKQGAALKGTLVFAKAGKIEVEFQVAPVGAASMGSHMHH